MANYTARANVASAAAVTLPEGSNYIVVTGTTNITSLSSRPSGEVVTLRFSGALTFTYNATSLILQDAVDLVTVAGDTITVISEGSGNWREISRRLVTAVVRRAGGQTTEGTTTSTTQVTVLTISGVSIPSPYHTFFVAGIRKTSGAANTASIGLAVNSTVLADPTAFTSSTNQAESGYFKAELLAGGVSNYPRAGHIAAGSVASTPTFRAFPTGDIPAATITSILIRALVADALITCGCDEAHAYVLTTS